MLQYLVILGISAQLIGITSYIKDTFKGKTKPNRITWLLWAVSPLIATAAALSEGVSWSVLPVFMAGFGPLLVLLASFATKKAYWKLEKFDYFCGICSILALVLWAATDSAEIAIIFSILSDGFASIPTLIKSFKFPETEIINPFAAGLFSSVTGLIAIETFNFSALAFPIYLIAINVILILTIKRKLVLNLFRAKSSRPLISEKIK